MRVTRDVIRTGVALGVAGAVVGAAVVAPSGPDRVATFRVATDEARIAAVGWDHPHAPGTGMHDHSDPATKNLISRAAPASGAVTDPTTAAQRAAAASYVERERALPDPRLTTVPVRGPRDEVPGDRYAMAGGCYTLQAPSGRYVATDRRRVALTAGSPDEATPFYFKATRLGSYLLHTDLGELGWDVLGLQPKILPRPEPRADWSVTRTDGGFTLRAKGRDLTVVAGRLTTKPGGAVAFRLRLADGCAAFPEAEVNVTGDPHAGITPFQEVRGYVDAHTHGMAFEFLGGRVHCGRPWHEYGAPYALKDCDDHTLTAGYGAALEAVLSGEPSHDPVGWPTFRDWPAPESLTHEGTYWKWLERSWRGGQRMLVNLLVENNQLCQLYPMRRNSCDDMTSIRLQARQMAELQDYIDAQYGGPGKGFYRIVRDPFEARRVVNAGKLAVVMGIETSVPFGCSFDTLLGPDKAQCTAAEIDAQLDEMHRLGVRQMELVNKFDNALAGVAGDAGAVGVVVNAANFLETGTFWQMEHCEPADGESHDNPQVTLPDVSAGQQDALFGAIGQLFGDVLPALPLYPQPAHCNVRGLTDLGAHTVRGLAKRQMVFDPDHLSVKARSAAMDVVEDLDYAGVISSHSWSTPDTYPRIYASGGFITPYAGDAEGFVGKWRRHLGWADPRYYWGIGFGADINGLGAQGAPRGVDAPNQVTYPIDGLGGVRIDRQRAGERTWDINADGVAQYGLYPDWVEDLRMIADAEQGDGAAIVDDMARGTEAYLQMWERAEGVAPDSCRNPGLRRSVAWIRGAVQKGMTTEQVMRTVGQPFHRLGSSYGICATDAAGRRTTASIVFDAEGRVVDVR
jgi:hypothetical protein